MLEPLLVAYFLHQFQAPVNPAFRPDRSVQHIRDVEQRGELTVEVSSANVGTVPPGASRVAMLTLRLTASCMGNVPINTISIQRRGLGFNSDIESVYAVHRNARVSSSRQIGSRDGQTDLNIRRLTIPACSSEEVTVFADFSPDASPSSEHTFEYKGVDAGKTTVRTARRLGNFTRARSISGTPIGELSLEYLRLHNRVRYGTRQRILRFTLTADRTDDHEIHAITFENNGSATNKDLQNLFIEFRNRRISNVAPSLDGDRVRFTFNPPFRINKNQTLKLGVRADVRASRSRTIQFTTEPSDIEASPIRGRR